MQCDRCDAEAVVHEIVVQNGEKVEKHLCSSCAKAEGLMNDAPSALSAPLSKLVMSSSIIAKPPKSAAAACPSCGETWAEFRKSGLLGCPECYDVFEEKLDPLIQRAHEGAARHVGKTPRKSAEIIDRRRLVASLRKQLLEAVDAEHYERAAELRDRLKHVEDEDAGEEMSDTGEGPGRGPGAEGRA